MNLLISALLIAFIFGTIEPPGGAGRVSLEREFKLRLGQSAQVRGEDLKIEFVSVPEDSRCPTGVNCIWEGNGRVSLRLRKARRDAASVALNTTTEPRNASYMNYELRLVNLSPYPKANHPIDKKSYVATLLVRRK
ncbi:MAG TPA: hypothetical protein VGB73_09155 [Pyrinomonadaceae bacterium]|jgi:hypothetical protein